MTQHSDPPAVGDLVAPESLVHRSSRTPEALREPLEAWLTEVLPSGATPRIVQISGTAANGQSSETLLFTAEHDEDGNGPRVQELVARLAPFSHDVPVFPSYDLPLQAHAIRTVAQHTTVSVPSIVRVEPDSEVLGTPFFVMERIEGEVPSDIPPYTFGDDWLHDATREQQAQVAEAMIGVLAELHQIDDATTRFAGLRHPGPGAHDLDRRIRWCERWYEFAAGDVGRSPLLDRAFIWLDANMPDRPSPTSLSWGDARLGNVMWRDFEPVAVLDWEMATLGPPELDLGWLVYAHRIFQDFAEVFELPGMPDFLRPDDVASTYEALTGHAPRDLDYFVTLAAVQWGIIFMRVGARQIHFGEMAPPAEVDELLRNSESLESMLASRRT